MMCYARPSTRQLELFNVILQCQSVSDSGQLQRGVRDSM